MSERTLTWAQYLDRLGLGTPAEVEGELLKGGDDEESIAGFRAARYLVLDRVREPDVNDAAVRVMLRKRRPPLPPGFEEHSGEYFDQIGNQWYALVAFDGDGLPPQTVL